MAKATADFELSGLRVTSRELDDGGMELELDWDEGSEWGEILVDKTVEEIIEILVTKTVEEEIASLAEEEAA
jgi:hypothetical protein